jgi:hypothetical protein
MWLPLVPSSCGHAFDWGVCANPASPRLGLLTFEHQGCPQFEEEDSEHSPPEVEPELEKSEPSLARVDPKQLCKVRVVDEALLALVRFLQDQRFYVLSLKP